MSAAGIITGNHPKHGPMFAAFDEAAHHVEPRVCGGRLGAILAPFRAETEAKAALERAGAVLR